MASRVFVVDKLGDDF